MNREERWVGGVVALSFWYFLGWWTLLAIPLISRLWAMGGSDRYDKNWRRLGVPTCMCGLMVLNLNHDLPMAGWPIIYGILTMGYGVPCHDDKGSPIGRFWYSQCFSDVKATIMTRVTLSILLGIAFLPLSYFNLTHWYLSTLTMTILTPLVVTCIE